MLWFKKKANNFIAYADGKLIPIEKVNDEVFSQKMMGDGVAIEPSDNKVYAPCDAVVTVVFEKTFHAVGLTLGNGIEVLIHCGLDTVNIEENVFVPSVKKGDKVKAGDLMLTFDREKLAQAKFDDVIMMVILNNNGKNIKLMGEQKVVSKETIIAEY
ncbi:MAG: PTS glucose transporter subunit IIA [Erysipelotrichaceae bacterium]|nr:PTS glucose transporter subunit IIA [Erysipelotrichaceae bacterium]